VIVRVTACDVVPGVMVADGANEAVAFAAGTVAARVMGLVYAPLEGATVRLKTAGSPEFTVLEEVEAVRM
jgi:hypothetical protein